MPTKAQGSPGTQLQDLRIVIEKARQIITRTVNDVSVFEIELNSLICNQVDTFA